MSYRLLSGCVLLVVFLASVSTAGSGAYPNLAPSLEERESWRLITHDDASGWMSVDQAHARTGDKSCYFVKENERGYVVLQTARPIQVKAGTKYTFRGYFHSENAALGTVLLFRVTRDGQSLAYDSIDRSAGWSGHSMLVNSPPGQWEKRVVTYKASEDGEIYLNLVLYGNPASVWVDDLEFTAEPYKIPRNVGEAFKTPYTREQVLDRLGERQSTTAEMVTRDSRTMLMVDERVTPPVIYKGLSPTKADYHGMASAGVDLVTVGVRIGGQRNQVGPWHGARQFDFEASEDALIEALRKNPDAVLILDLWVYPYIKWGQENLEEVWINDKGEYAYGWWGNLEGFTDDPTLASVDTPQRTRWLYPSYQSEKWRQDAGEAVTKLIEHLRGTPAWKAVGGVFITGGHDGQYVTMFGQYDYSPTTLRKFRAWLKQRYEVIGRANASWGSNYSGFDDIGIPMPASRSGNLESGTPYLPPSLELDYRQFLDEQAWGIKDYFAGIAKAAASKPIVALTYYGSRAAMKNFLRTKHLDAAGGMSYYPYRLPGFPIGFGTENDFSLHGKMFIQEIDLRSWVGSIYDEMYQRWIGAGDTPERWHAIERKLVGMSLANDYGYWYYDMGRYYNDPRILERIGKTYQIADAYWQKQPTDFQPDVAVILSEDGEMYHRPTHSSVKSGMAYQRMLLETSGVPYRVHYLDEVLSRPELQDYKVYIFLMDNYIIARDRQRIDEVLKNGGRTLVWLYDAGYITETGGDVDALSELVGMHVQTEERFTRDMTVTTGQSDSLLEGVQPLLGMSDLILAIMNLEGRNAFNARYQPFWINDASVRPLANYVGTGRVAIGYKDYEDWRSIYFATPNSLGNQLLNNIASAAGAYVAGDAGQSLFMNDRFVSVHGLRDGSYTLRLPRGRSRVIDPDTGDVLADDVQTYTFDIQAQWTYWFFLE